MRTLEQEIDLFATWLEKQGHELLPTRGDWEVIRWRVADAPTPYMGFTNKHRAGITKFNSRLAENIWLDYRMATVDVADPGMLERMHEKAAETLQHLTTLLTEDWIADLPGAAEFKADIEAHINYITEGNDHGTTPE